MMLRDEKLSHNDYKSSLLDQSKIRDYS
jgi:hypothetical protein